MRTPTGVSGGQSLAGVKDHAARATRDAAPWIEGVGRFGYAAKGVVYLAIGLLALQAALGRGGGTTDQPGALARIAEAPFGGVLLVVVTVGLFGYAIWRLVQAIEDTENKGSESKGLLTRGVYAGVGLIYLGLALSALKVVLGLGAAGGSTQQTQDWTARLMGHPLGAMLIGLIGLAVIANGAFQLYRAYTAEFREKLRTDELDANQVDLITRIGRAGFAARGVAFGVIGLLLVTSALHAEPSEARGLDGALAALAEQPFGPYLLALVAAGLAAYGVFALVEARYRRMLFR